MSTRLSPNSPPRPIDDGRRWELTLTLVAAVLAVLSSCAAAGIGIWGIALQSRAEIDGQVRQERRESYISLVQVADSTAKTFKNYDGCQEASIESTSTQEIQDAVNAFEAAVSEASLTSTTPVINASVETFRVIVESYKIVVNGVTTEGDCQTYSSQARDKSVDIQNSINDLRVAMREDLQYFY